MRKFFNTTTPLNGVKGSAKLLEAMVTSDPSILQSVLLDLLVAPVSGTNGSASANGGAGYGVPPKAGAANSNTNAGTNNTGPSGSTIAKNTSAAEGDSEGKEKGHSAAAEALLTLLKK